MTEQTAHKEPLTDLELEDRRGDLFARCIATANLLTIAFQHHSAELRDDTIPNAAFALAVDLDELKELVEAETEGGAS